MLQKHTKKNTHQVKTKKETAKASDERANRRVFTPSGSWDTVVGSTSQEVLNLTNGPQAWEQCILCKKGVYECKRQTIRATEKPTWPDRLKSTHHMVVTYCATLTMTGRQARIKPISSTPRKKKLELEALNGRVAGRQLLTNDTWQKQEHKLLLDTCSILTFVRRKWSKLKVTFLM